MQNQQLHLHSEVDIPQSQCKGEETKGINFM